MTKHSNMWGAILIQTTTYAYMKHFRLVSEIGVIENLVRTLQPLFVSRKAKLSLIYVLMRLSSSFILPSTVTLQLWVTPMSVSLFLVRPYLVVDYSFCVSLLVIKSLFIINVEIS